MNDSMPTHVNLLSLAANPNYLEVLVDQQWQVWGYDERKDLLEFFAQEFSDEMPRTWLLIDNNKKFPHDVIGAVTLSLNEMGACQPPTRNPWLGYLYIDPHYRGQGLAKLLTNYAVTQAHQLGYPTVYLYASDETARYQQWGWQIIDTLVFQGETVNVMVQPDDSSIR